MIFTLRAPSSSDTKWRPLPGANEHGREVMVLSGGTVDLELNTAQPHPRITIHTFPRKLHHYITRSGGVFDHLCPFSRICQGRGGTQRPLVCECNLWNVWILIWGRAELRSAALPQLISTQLIRALDPGSASTCSSIPLVPGRGDLEWEVGGFDLG